MSDLFPDVMWYCKVYKQSEKVFRDKKGKCKKFTITYLNKCAHP